MGGRERLLPLENQIQRAGNVPEPGPRLQSKDVDENERGPVQASISDRQTGGAGRRMRKGEKKKGHLPPEATGGGPLVIEAPGRPTSRRGPGYFKNQREGGRERNHG